MRRSQESARVKSQDSRLKAQESSRLKTQESSIKKSQEESRLTQESQPAQYVCMKRLEASGHRKITGHKPQKRPHSTPPKKIKFQNWYSVEHEKHFTLGTTTAFHRRWCHPAAGAPLLRNPCTPGKPNILAKPSKLREPPPLA